MPQRSILPNIMACQDERVANQLGSLLWYSACLVHIRGFDLTKAELPLEGIFFPTQFSSLGIFINKKLEIDKTKTT